MTPMVMPQQTRKETRINRETTDPIVEFDKSYLEG